MDKPMGKSTFSKNWAGDPKCNERARVVLAVSLAKRTPGELVRIIMDWLDDQDLYAFCNAYLEDTELEWISGREG
jgi:hypothetical protein